MAMSGGSRSALSGLSDLRKEKNDENENLWTKILAEVQSTDRNKLPSCKSVLVLGDNESGKTTLVAKLQCNEDPKKGSGLEYAYIDVRDEYRDEHTRLGVWVLDGDPRHSELLQFGVNAVSVEHTVVLLTVSMATPWAIMDQLHSWASLLHEHLDTLKFSHEQAQHQHDLMVHAWQSYVEPGDELDGSGGASPLKPQPPPPPGHGQAGAGQRTSRNLEDEAVLLPLPEGVLTRNLGLPIIVVVTKTDYMSTLEKDMDYKEEHFDYIQQSIRKFCLQYGASLFYTSVKEDKNCDLLYKYLVHRIYNFPFRTPALVVEKDAVFIPAGWDNEKKISILFENLHTMSSEDYYPDVIVRPPTLRKSVVREVEVCAEEEQQFLARHHSQLAGSSPLPPTAAAGQASLTPNANRTPSVGGTPQTPQGQKVPDRRVSTGTTPGQMGSPKKLDPSKPGVPGANEGVLANFFNSLLNKKTATMPSPTNIKTPNDKAAMRSDAAAELDRLTRSTSKSPHPPALSASCTNNNQDVTSLANNTTTPTANNNASEC